MRALALIAVLFFPPYSVAVSEYEDGLAALISEVESNPATKQGYWLEMWNALDEWEKTILVFGYANPGDLAACREIQKMAEQQSPDRLFRCNPVND